MTAIRVHTDWYFLLHILPIAGLIWLVWLAMRKGRSLPCQATPQSRTARRAEAIALGGIGVSMLAMLFMYRRIDGMLYAFREGSPAGARVEYWTTLAVWSSVIGGTVLLARFWSTMLACIALIVFFCGAGYAVNEGWVLGYKSHIDEIRAIPVPLEIHLAGDVEGADVWLNGVHVGKTPIHADMDELLARVPDLEERPEEWGDPDKMYRNRKNRLLNRFVRLDLAPPTKVARDDEEPEYRDIYARVELNGQRMFSDSSLLLSRGSRRPWNDSPCYVRLNMVLPRWEEQVNLLVQQARLNDYRVEAQWIEAADSYADRTWELIGDELEVEPRLQEVVDRWVRHRYELDGIDDHASAFAVLQRIVAEADRQDGYRTDSIAGRAVELLVPHLDPERLVNPVAERIAGYRFPPGRGPTFYGQSKSGRFIFGTHPPRPRKPKLTAGAFVWAHAVWQLDRLLDLEDDTRDNLVEERITPALLRLEPRPDRAYFDLALGLGGSCVDRLLRPSAHRPHDSVGFGDEGAMSVSGAFVNRNLYNAAGRKSPAGRAFREEHMYDILEMTEKIVRDSSAVSMIWPRNTIDYLFLDVNETEDNLAVHFWPRFNKLATRSEFGGEVAEVRWHYLARMQPYCTPEMFTEVYRRCRDHRVIMGSNSQALNLLEPTLRFEVLAALREEARQLLGKAKRRTYGHQISEANVFDFTQHMLRVPCEESAQSLLAWLEEESPDHEQRIRQVTRWCEYDDLSIYQLRALAQTRDPGLRRLVFPSIRARATPERRAILERLLEDEDEGIREEAEGVKAELEELLGRSIPLRGGV